MKVPQAALKLPHPQRLQLGAGPLFKTQTGHSLSCDRDLEHLGTDLRKTRIHYCDTPELCYSLGRSSGPGWRRCASILDSLTLLPFPEAQRPCSTEGPADLSEGPPACLFAPLPAFRYTSVPGFENLTYLWLSGFSPHQQPCSLALAGGTGSLSRGGEGLGVGVSEENRKLPITLPSPELLRQREATDWLNSCGKRQSHGTGGPCLSGASDTGNGECSPAETHRLQSPRQR